MTSHRILALCLFLTAAVAAPIHARAEDTSLGVWRGAGKVFTVDGQDAGDFTVELTRRAIDEHTVELNGTVKLANGEERPIHQRTTRKEGTRTFRLESDRGKGGGLCVGDGMCQSYEETPEGRAWATTIVFDGQKMRLLTTELDHGRAVRLMQQTLTRK